MNLRVNKVVLEKKLYEVEKPVETVIPERLDIVGTTLLSVEEAEAFLTQEERAYNGLWWLRSPGDNPVLAMVVDKHGKLCYSGHNVADNAYLRPAFKIRNFDSFNFQVEDRFKIGEWEFKIISKKLAWMCNQDLGFRDFNLYPTYFGSPNDFELSNIKGCLINWFSNVRKTYKEK